jgi:5-methylcytosine-specific restriction endonuclease McrA
MALERKEKYTIEQVLVHVRGNTNVKDKDKLYMEFDGDQVKIRSDRLLTFRRKGTRCVGCGVEGLFFAKERVVGSSGHWHMNLYALDNNRQEVLMTKDHIVPKSKGGANALYNYQPMCSHCNGEKADLMPRGVNPKTQQKHTKDDLQKETDKLRSVLGGKDAAISNLIRDKDLMSKEIAQLKVENVLLRKRVKQLAEILSNP